MLYIISFWYACLLSYVPSIKQQQKYPIKSNENSFWHSEQDSVLISIDKWNSSPYQLYSWDCKPPGNGINAIFSVLCRINSIQRYYNLFLIAFCHCHGHPDERARQRSVFTANLWGWYRRLLWFAPLRRPESSQWSCHWVRPRRLSRSSCAGAQRWGRVPRWQQGKWMDPRAAGKKK